tara:strand:+ start:5892 stop:6194 length:303 start_codon:yes stop_codon:yes gene_type:complete
MRGNTVSLYFYLGGIRLGLHDIQEYEFESTNQEITDMLLFEKSKEEGIIKSDISLKLTLESSIDNPYIGLHQERSFTKGKTDEFKKSRETESTDQKSKSN